MLTLLMLCFTAHASSQVVNHWRGPNRDGVFPDKNLLREWPAQGPEIAWVNSQLGLGYSSPTFANGKIYITGMENQEGFVYTLSLDGKLMSKFSYGPERYDGYPGSRTSPAVVDNLLYMVNAFGRLICMDLNTGGIKWAREFFSDFDGQNLRWGYTENMIIDGDRIYCTPGGTKYNVVALNRFTGEPEWVSPGMGDLSAYCSPLLVTHNGIRLLVTMMAKHIIGINAANGELLWSYPYQNQRSIHPNTPIYSNGYLFGFSGYAFGGVKLKIAPDARSVTKQWFNSSMDNQMGGAILHNGYIYGSGDRNRFWYCIRWETGEDVWQSSDLAKGTVIMADGMLYIYSERGELALVEPSPDGLKIRSQTMVTHGSEQHWAHLVINNGVLYVRRGEALIAYRIK